MDARQLALRCPCCRSRIEVDVRTGHVLRWSRAEEVDETGKPLVREEDWEEARQRATGRLGSAAEKLEEGLARERTREGDLDALFRKAREKLARRAEEESERG